MKPEEKTPKKERRRLAKAELLVLLACKTSQWQTQVADEPNSGTIPFAEWPDDDPFRVLAKRYDLTGADLGKILDGLGSELERRADRAGYDDCWVDL